MTLIVDAAPLVALADRNDRLRDAVRTAMLAEQGALIVPAPVAAEVDHLLGRRIGRAARLAFLDDLRTGQLSAVCLDIVDYARVAELEARYSDLDIGLADASVVVLAARYETRRVLTFDERHFRALRPLQGGAFDLLPGVQHP